MGIFHNFKTILFKIDTKAREHQDYILNRKVHFETMRSLQVKDLKRDVEKLKIKERANIKDLTSV